MKTKTGQKGTTVVEFALVAPLLFVLMFGIFEFGLLLFDKAVITNASREGARAGIVFDTANLRGTDNKVVYSAVDTEVKRVVNEYFSSVPLISPGSTSTHSVNTAISGDDPGDTLTVTVTYPFRHLIVSKLTALIGGPLSDTVNLSAVTNMRFE